MSAQIFLLSKLPCRPSRTGWEVALRAAAERDVRARDSTAVCVAMDLRYATVDLDGETGRGVSTGPQVKAAGWSPK
jgi:hypothetical protein